MRIVRSAERFVTRRPGIVTTHGFAFGQHYDPARTSFGRLVAHNVERVSPGHGYDLHQHRDVEIVTWVVEGTLRHTDLTDGDALAPAFAVQRLDAEAPAGHAEVNAAEADTPAASDVTFVQLWFAAGGQSGGQAGDSTAGRQRYAVAQVAEADLRAGLVLLAGSLAEQRPRVRLRQQGISVYAAMAQTGTDVVLPDAPYVHVYVVRGVVRLHGGEILEAADGAELRSVPGATAHAESDAHLLIAAMS